MFFHKIKKLKKGKKVKVDYACYYSIQRNLLNFQEYNSDL